MAKQTLEKRVAALEAEMAKMQESLHEPSLFDWHRAIDKYGDDEDIQAVFAAAMRLREAERNRVRKRRGKAGSKS